MMPVGERRAVRCLRSDAADDLLVPLMNDADEIEAVSGRMPWLLSFARAAGRE